jgi:phage portal protein BeeE
MPLWNSLLGTSRLGLVRQAIGVSIGLEEHQARFIGQGARTGGVLSTDQKLASKEVREQLREEWQRLQVGPKNSGATAILEQEGPAMVQMGKRYVNGPISSYCERWKAKGEKFFALGGVGAFLV